MSKIFFSQNLNEIKKKIGQSKGKISIFEKEKFIEYIVLGQFLVKKELGWRGSNV